MNNSISFGHGTGRKLQRGSRAWQTILIRLNQFYDVPTPSRRFPGPLPVSMMRKDLHRVFFSGADFSITYKSHGVRHLMLFTTLREYPVCVMVDRGLEMYVVHICAPSFAYRGTLLDVELVHYTTPNGEKRCIVEVMDIVAMNGMSSLKHLYFTQRMDVAAQFVDLCANVICAAKEAGEGEAGEGGGEIQDRIILCKQYAEMGAKKWAGGSKVWFNDVEGAAFDVVVKPIFRIQQAQHLHECVVPLLPFEEDGRCLVEVAKPVQPMQCPSILKWKDYVDHTIDFIVYTRAPFALAPISPIPPQSSDPDIRIFQDDTEYVASTLCVPLWLGVCADNVRDIRIFSRACATPNAIHELLQSTVSTEQTGEREETGAREQIETGDEYDPNFPMMYGGSDTMGIDGKIVECRWQPEAQCWILEAIRSNRSYPNSLNTVQKTCINIVENVRIEELFCDEKSTIFHPDYVSPFAVKTNG